MAEIHEGGCLCGNVRYRVVGDPKIAGVCHCNLCKRKTGSAFDVFAYFDESAVELTRGDLKTYEYRSDESGRWIKLEFCPDCGTTVRGAAEWAPAHVITYGGTFDDPNWVKPAIHIWARSAVHWMAFPADVPVIEIGLIDAANALSEGFPPHVHGENCPECIALVDLSRLAICCEARDLHVLAPIRDGGLLVQCLNPKCLRQAKVPKGVESHETRR